MTNIDISRNEFRGFVYNQLEGYFEEDVIGKEYYYYKNIGNNYLLRILSSVDSEDKESRDKNDSIKVHIYYKDEDSILKAASHTKRTPGYRKRIKNKIDNLIKCSKCDSELRIAKGEYGEYFFCTDDDCEYTESIN